MMSLKFYIIPLIIVFLCINQAFAQKTKVIGKWKFDMEVMKPLMMDAFENEQKNATDEGQKERLKGILEGILEDFGKITLEFKADGTFEYIKPANKNDEEEIKIGTWTIEDGYLLRTFKDTARKDKVKIKEVTASALVVIPEEDANNPFEELTLKRVE